MTFGLAIRLIVAAFILMEVKEHAHWAVFIAITWWAVQWELFMWAMAHQHKQELARQKMIRDAIDKVQEEVKKAGIDDDIRG